MPLPPQVTDLSSIDLLWADVYSGSAPLLRLRRDLGLRCPAILFGGGALPKGAVPDLSVDGTIELERLNDVLFMGRPAFGQDQSVVGLFKIGGDGVNAERVQVKLGRSSVNTIEVLSGLKVGDQVILSDMSAYDAYDRIRLK